MLPIRCLALTALTLLVGACAPRTDGCARAPAPAPVSTTEGEAPRLTEPSATSDSVAIGAASNAPSVSTTATAQRSELPQHQSLDELRRRVREAIFASTPTMNPEAVFPIRELTTDAVWEQLGAQLVQVTEGPRQYQGFVIRGSRVERIGVAVGGFGLVSFCVADISGDGQPDLAYSFSWGSGIHRSRVAYADLTGATLVEHVAPEACFQMSDMAVGNAADGGVEVMLNDAVIGRLVATSADPGVRLELTEGVAPSVLSRRRR